VKNRGVDAPPDFRQFAVARTRQLFRIAFLMCGDWHDAEDLVQTTLAKLFVAWNRVQRRDSMDSYARTVMLNAFLSQRRLRRSGETPTAEFGDVSAPDIDADLRITLVCALQRLAPRSRAVVVLRYVEDQSIESVAQLMGTTPAAIKSLNTRGLAQLRELLGADQDLLQS
jgi:RNA polymerase sigma-70 factor (sigma-E family)